MKHLSFLTLLALAFAGFASAQSVTVSRDTVYEIDNDGGNNVGPITEITILNTTSDTLFTDTVIVDLLTSPVPENINFQFGYTTGGGGSIGISVREEYQFEQISAAFAPGIEKTLDDFCLDVPFDPESMFLRCGRSESESPSDYVLAVIRVQWYFTSGDSMSFFVKGDYWRGSVPIGKSLKPQPVLQGIEGTPYLINGKSVERHSKGKTPVPIIRRTRDD